MRIDRVKFVTELTKQDLTLKELAKKLMLIELL